MKKELKLRVLISAYACEPGRGSEPGVGWNMAKVMSDKVHLTVITRANNRSVIEQSDESWTKNVNWIFYDPPVWLTWWKKGGRGVQLFYIIWQIGIYIKMRSLVKVMGYDIVHHVTFGKYWVPSLLPLLKIPFFFGSVGGGEYTPESLVTEVSPLTIRSERIKRKVAWVLACNPFSRLLYRNMALAYAATEQTQNELSKLGVSQIKLLPQSGISQDELDYFEKIRYTVQENKDYSFAVCTAARLIPWKGVDLCVRAFLLAFDDLPEKSVLKIASDGSEMARLKKIVSDAGAEDKVKFLGKLPELDDVYKLIVQSNGLLHAATSEAFGQACVESLGLGVPVICWDWAGPGLIVDETCGFAINPSSLNLVEAFAAAIVELSKQTRKTKEIQQSICIQRIRDKFLWEKIGNEVMTDYQAVIN